MFIQEDDLKLNDWQFSQRKYLPYKVKKTLAERRIKEWYYNWDGQVYLSYSGGLDSTALLHMIRKNRRVGSPGSILKYWFGIS